MKNKTILFFHINLRTGGIETLIVRMVNWLVSNGYSVKLLLQYGGELLSLVDKRVEVKILNLKAPFMFLPGIARIVSKDNFFNNIDLIYTMDPETCWLGVLLHSYLEKKPIFLTGVYHPRAYMMEDVPKAYRILFKSHIGDDLKIFMNEATLKSHEVALGTVFEKSKIWPLPVDSSSYNMIKRNPIKYKVVSVGRLVDFKSYNIHMIKVIQALLLKGHDIQYHIYGYGDMENELRRMIVKEHLEERVYFHGKLVYSEFKNTMIDAFAFVGMGTSLIESALCKVPGIVAVENSTHPESYGYIYELPEYSCGESIPGKRVFNIEYLLENLFNLSDSEYHCECEKSYEHAMRFDIEKLMPEFLGLLTMPVISKIQKVPFKYYYQVFISTLYRRIKTNVIVRLKQMFKM